MSQQRIRELQSELARLRKNMRKRKAKKLGWIKRKGMGCRDRDEALKAERGYTNPSSYVRGDGSEKLVGEDWKNRVEELRQRSGGRCEQWIPVWNEPVGSGGRCPNKADDPHHITRRSVRRDDRMNNLKHVCRFCHDALDERKPRWTKR
jgi:hypothetical protein